MAFPSRDQFLSTFLRQRFALPDSMVYYILKNPKSSKLYQKMIQTCKYFFIKNSMLILHCLHIDDDGWKICTNQTNCAANDFRQSIDNRILSNCKLWIDCQIRIYSTDPNAASDLIPKIYQCDATRAFFADQEMSLQQFLFYSRNAEACILEVVTVSSDACAEIPLEEIVAILPNISRILIEYGPYSKNVSSDTIKKLMKIPHFKNFTKLRICNASELLDIDSIYDHYKKNRSEFTFGINYENELPEVLAKKLDGIVDEILEFMPHINETPFIQYPKQNIFVNNNIMLLHDRSITPR